MAWVSAAVATRYSLESSKAQYKAAASNHDLMMRMYAPRECEYCRSTHTQRTKPECPNCGAPSN